MAFSMRPTTKKMRAICPRSTGAKRPDVESGLGRKPFFDRFRWKRGLMQLELRRFAHGHHDLDGLAQIRVLPFEPLEFLC